MIRNSKIWLLVWLLCVALCPSTVDALHDSQDEIYKGMGLRAEPSPPGVKYNVSIVGKKKALENLRVAIDLIYSRSPSSAKAIDLLKKNGHIVIVYDPSYPRKDEEFEFLKVALFKHTYFERMGVKKTERVFPIIVSRHGIKWPTPELAAVLIHELVGHGGQHLRDEVMRPIDKECEAWLLEEKAYQDFGMDKRSRTMIKFRQQLEGHGFVDGHCSSFKRYLGKNDPEKMKLWERLNPDVSSLLAVFKDYTKFLRDQGAPQKAQSASKLFAKANLEKVLREGEPAEQFKIGLMYSKGRGVAQNFAEAVKWFGKAAEQGNADAQSNLGFMYGMGIGVLKDYVEAVKWYRKAAEQGNANAQYHLSFSKYVGKGMIKDTTESYFWAILAEKFAQGKLKKKALVRRGNLAKKLTPAQIKNAEQLARKWNPKQP